MVRKICPVCPISQHNANNPHSIAAPSNILERIVRSLSAGISKELGPNKEDAVAMPTTTVHVARSLRSRPLAELDQKCLCPIACRLGHMQGNVYSMLVCLLRT